MRKLATAAISFSAAVLLSQFLLPDSWLPYGALVFTALSFSGLLFRSNRRLRIFLIFIGCAAGFIWSFLYWATYEKPAEKLNDSTSSVSAIVCTYPDVTDYGSKIIVRIKLEDSPAVKTQLYVYGSVPDITPGNTVAFTASFRSADSIYGEKTDTFHSKGIYLLATLKNDITVTDASESIVYLPARLAHALSLTIERIFPPDTIAFMKALILGETSGIYKDTALSSALSATGTSHIVAVSGMNIAFLMSFMGLFVKNKRALAHFGIPVILLFMAIVGFMAPVVRAGIMQIFLLLAPLVRRENDPPTALSASLFIILMFNPYAITGIGLQLSFTATLGLLLFTEKIYTSIDEQLIVKKIYNNSVVKKVSRFIIASLAATAGALVFSIPLIALHFGSLSLIAPLTNLVILIPVTITFCGGVAALAVGMIYAPAGSIVAFLVSLPALFILNIISWFSHIPFASVYTENPALVIWLIYVYMLLIIAFSLRLKRRQLIYPVCISAASLCLILLLTSVISNSRDVSVTALDVGQGQSIVVTSGEYTAVIDCGSTSGKDAGDIVVKYLQSQGRTTVDLLVLTHFHTDHANGVPELLERCRVAALAVPEPDSEDDPLTDKIFDIAHDRGTQIINVTENLSVSLGDTAVQLYAPIGDTGENERGLTILCSENNFDALITGDMSAAVERQLIQSVQLPDIELLIVGHHGSKYATSDELLNTVLPETAIISVGYNSYGHPSQEILYKLAQDGVLVYRTDDDGTVTVRNR